MTTKTQLQSEVEALRAKCEEQRIAIASLTERNAQYDRKLFALNSERSKWEQRARTAQNRSVSSFAERAVAAREEAIRTGKCVAIGGA